MISRRTFLAVDLGAESGRVLSGGFDGQRVDLEEVHRFPTLPVRVADGLYSDALGIFREVREGMVKAASGSAEVASVGVDAWGVDFALLDRDGALVSNPRHYRDSRTEGVVEKALAKAPGWDIYRATGAQFVRVNTLYQLLSMEDSPLLEAAETLLMMPDLVAYWLSGEKAAEVTNATTTQMYDPVRGDWAWGLLETLGLPGRLLPGAVEPGTAIGGLLPGTAEETGLPPELPVVAVASHDTASAVAAVPAEGQDFAYISSGTWSMVGVETAKPIITRQALRLNFANEGGFGGTNRLLRNVMGLWLLQECRRAWEREGRRYSYEDLVRMAEQASPFGPWLNPDHPSFLPPGDMPGRIRRFCETTGQRVPRGPGEVSRCVFESLALKYRMVLEAAEGLSGKRAEKIHVVGGGSRNALLCQITADATGRTVVAGPAEATALGNLMVQAYAADQVGSLEEIRAVVRASTDPTVYRPAAGGDDRWDEAYDAFCSLVVGDENAAPATGSS